MGNSGSVRAANCTFFGPLRADLSAICRTTTVRTAAVAKRNRGPKFTRFLSRLLKQTPLSRRTRTGKRSQSNSQHTSELLENRALLTLVGVDFGGGLVPANWASVDTGPADQVLTNLSDDEGTATGIDLDIDYDVLPGAFDLFSPDPSEIPAHSTSLAGLDHNYEDQGSVGLTFQNLVAGQTYEVYVFAGDTFSDTQTVTISDAAAGTTLTSFQQLHAANQLLINDQVGDDTRTLSSYAVLAPADVNGDLTITVESSPGTFLGLAGVALGVPTPPSELYLNEIVADVPGGIDNPNEYVEIRGQIGQSLNDVFLVFVDGNDSPSQGEIRSGTGGVVDLSGAAVGATGFAVVADDTLDPYAIDPAAGIINVPGLDFDYASYTAFLIHVDPLNGTAPVAGQDLDAGNDGLDALPTGWTVLDSVGVLTGAPTARSYGDITFSGTADGFSEAGSQFVTTGFGPGNSNHVMRVGDSTGSQPADWVAFEISGTAPSFTVAQSTDAAYQTGSFITNHVGSKLGRKEKRERSPLVINVTR